MSSKGTEQAHPGNTNLNRADIRARTRLENKERCPLMMKRSILQDDLTILNEHVPNSRVSHKPKVWTYREEEMNP